MAARAHDAEVENQALVAMKEWTPSLQLERTASSQLEMKVRRKNRHGMDKCSMVMIYMHL